MLFLGAVLFEGRTAFSMVPHFDRTFQEMIGPRDLLPTFTQFVIRASRFQQSVGLLILPVLLALLALLWWRRGAAWICILCGAVTLLFAGLAAAAYPAMLIPYAKMMHDLDVPPPSDEERAKLFKEILDRTPER